MFKSITTYATSADLTGKTFSGSGIVSIIQSENNTGVTIDGYEITSPNVGTNYIFSSSTKIRTTGSGSQNKIKATIALFN